MMDTVSGAGSAATNPMEHNVLHTKEFRINGHSVPLVGILNQIYITLDCDSYGVNYFAT